MLLQEFAVARGERVGECRGEGFGCEGAAEGARWVHCGLRLGGGKYGNAWVVMEL